MKVPRQRAARTPFKLALLSLVCLLSFGALYSAYTWYQTRYIRPFSEQDILFEGSPLALPNALAGPGKVRLVHVWDPSCPCNVGNQQHLAELLQRLSPEVEFYVLQKPASHGQLPLPLSGLKPLPYLAGSASIPASPAVAVWNKQGQLAYFGPYSAGAVCTADNSFIEPILQAVLADRPVHVTHNLASGCFCDWATDTAPARP